MSSQLILTAAPFTALWLDDTPHVALFALLNCDVRVPDQVCGIRDFISQPFEIATLTLRLLSRWETGSID